MRAPSPIFTCPTIPTWPASTTPEPISVDPEIPTWATISESGPIRTLWPICTRLSTLVPRPTTVSPRVARSTQVQAPSSTSSSMRAMPACGTLRWIGPSPSPSRSNAKPNPSDPTTALGCRTTRSPRTQRSRTTAPVHRMQSAPTRASSSTAEPGCRTLRGPDARAPPASAAPLPPPLLSRRRRRRRRLLGALLPRRLGGLGRRLARAGAETVVVAAHDLVGHVGGGGRIEQRALVDDERDRLALRDLGDDLLDALQDGRHRLLLLPVHVLLQVAGGLARLDERLLELFLLLALGIVGEDGRLLFVFLLHPFQVTALLVDLRAPLVVLPLEA